MKLTCVARGTGSDEVHPWHARSRWKHSGGSQRSVGVIFIGHLAVLGRQVDIMPAPSIGRKVKQYLFSQALVCRQVHPRSGVIALMQRMMFT